MSFNLKLAIFLLERPYPCNLPLVGKQIARFAIWLAEREGPNA